MAALAASLSLASEQLAHMLPEEERWYVSRNSCPGMYR